ncbi:Fis family transcriptional regulator [Thiohalorhabdus denitrificans]|uniref:Sigma54 specific transcriptional regulator, Fis family n=1 Tax=Thiohalorhabdus denitrificans TaxID=381306 RepID=A0A0P9ERT1_9GAMM|nr:sigma 54-interacting transcriptional regulator [Thiohalorhabdus denitrificans]KPV41242.1 Fis family transcriptional regulator [Thiohalorhabdus denitrificans]SCY34842.1 sigma54 specific transcriptional regulator, Fis family [Thiohalorhabdus denitrificans]
MHPTPDPVIQSLIDAQEGPFVLIDGDYRVVAANTAYREAYGLGADEPIVGRRCYEVSHHLDHPCHLDGEDCPHRRVFETQRQHVVLHTHYDRSGRAEHVRIKGHPVAGPGGERLVGEAITRLAGTEDMDCEEMRLIGNSPALLRAVDKLTQVAQSDLGILLLGESGVGKDLAARYVHSRSPRREGPFQVVDCSTLNGELFESEIFGHEPGAFTGCVGRKQGLFELADGGTLFLDEVGELPLAMQAKLLRALESGQFRRLGAEEAGSADVRVVTATNRDLAAMVREGTFREDLYYRLACITIQLPSLRERREDIPALAEALLTRINRANGTHCTLSSAALERLSAYDFPGNIRELRNILQRAVALCSGGVIGVEELGLEGESVPVERYRAAAPPSLRELELRSIQELLERYEGRRKPVAEALGMSERTLYRKLKRYGLN